MCNCKWLEIIVAVVVFVMVMWPALLGSDVSKWVAAIAAVILLIHALMCKNCAMGAAQAKGGKKKKR